MKISVITVCRNSAPTLTRTLKSVAEQDWPNLEHIIIDGASTDNTKEILDRFKSGLADIVSEPDKGIYDAMNKGLERASGDVICFLNADDHYPSTNVLSKVIKNMDYYKLDALMGDVGYFHSKDPEKLVRRYRSNRFTPNRLAWGWMPAHPALFLTKDVVRRVKCFKTNYQIAGDFEFIIRAFHQQSLRYHYISEVLVLMQTGGISTAGLRSKILLNQEVLQACRENGIDTNLFKILSKYPAKVLEIISPKKTSYYE